MKGEILDSLSSKYIHTYIIPLIKYCICTLSWYLRELVRLSTIERIK